ncbi:MAG TPA: alpha/beta fold hydrolase [Ktedonobacterales bacterium]|nr:alpha/beta fold hydrolase [Ktedonobacterales bacterium]
MDTFYATAPDGVRIAYDRSGSGPALLLLHGLPGERQRWHTAGYIEPLSQHFTVLTVDARGNGESDHPADPAAYAEERILADILAVADANRADHFSLWGHSFGASITRQLAATNDRVTRAVMAGGVFGPIFTQDAVDPIVAELKPLADAQAAGTLDQLDISPKERAEAASYPFAVVIATLQSLVGWRQIQPDQIHCPLLVYTGTNDHVLGRLENQRPAIEMAGHRLIIFDELDHGQLVDARETVLPVTLPFLLGQ